MPADTIDVIEHQLRTGDGQFQQDTYISRVSVSTYAQQSNKNLTARPTQIFIQRLATGVTVTLWPVPDSANYTLYYFRLKGIDGLASGVGGDIANIPPRFVPALVSGLAYYIAMKRPEVERRVLPLKQEYEFQFELAANEDQETATIQFVPFGMFSQGL